MNHTEKEWIDIFIKYNAYLKGHFCLSSGMHSEDYFQSALLLKNPWMSSLCGQDMIQKLSSLNWDVVVCLACGSVIIGHELARHSKTEFLFMERVNGFFVFRRGFAVDMRKKVLIVEDVVTSGRSVNEVIEILEKNNNKISGVVSIVDRSENCIDFQYPFFSLIKMSFKSHAPQNCPLCQKSLPLLTPGSRFLNS